MTVTLLDTGVLYAAIDSSVAHHQACGMGLQALDRSCWSYHCRFFILVQSAPSL